MPTVKLHNPAGRGALGRAKENVIRWSGVACLLASAALLAELQLSRTRAAETPAAEGVLILRNGEVLQGLITPRENSFEVALPKGAVRVRSRDVEFHCRTLHEGYERKNATVPPARIVERLALAEWCLRHELLAEAREQIDLARAIDAEHPRLVLLERRLQLAMAPPRERAPGAEAPVPSVSLEDLDRLIRGLPAGSVEAYVNSVQPLLLNHCATAGCHNGSSNSSFRLMRPAAGKPASRRLTQRNLHAVWQLIDLQAPEASPLLTAPIRPHGSVDTPIFTTARVMQYQQIVAWVLHASGSVPEPGAMDVSQTVSPLMQPRPRRGWSDVPPAAPREPSAEESSRNSSAEDEAPSAAEDLSQRLLAGAAAESEVAPEERREAEVEAGSSDEKPANPEPVEPRDEFDPELFNRQFAPAK